MRPIASGSLVLAALVTIALSARGQLDRAVFDRIRHQAFDESAVMDHAFFLSDVYGARLTGSPAFAAAGEWAMQRLRDIGGENVQRHPIDWGTGWSYETFSGSSPILVQRFGPQEASEIPRRSNGPRGGPLQFEQ